MASEEFVKRIILEEENERDDADDKIQSEWSQWTHDERLLTAKPNAFNIDVQDCFRERIAHVKETELRLSTYFMRNWSRYSPVSQLFETPSESEIKRATLLASKGYLHYFEELRIKDVDITDIPQDQIKKLASKVLITVYMINMTHADQLDSILYGIECRDLGKPSK